MSCICAGRICNPSGKSSLSKSGRVVGVRSDELLECGTTAGDDEDDDEDEDEVSRFSIEKLDFLAFLGEDDDEDGDSVSIIK